MSNKTINILIVVPSVILGFLLNSCTSSLNNSNRNSEEIVYDITEFNRINFEGAYNIELRQGDGPSISMKTTKDLQEKVRIWVSDSTLYVKTDVKNISSDEIKLNIHFNKLEMVNIEGGAFLKTFDKIELKDFGIHIEGGASVFFDVTAENIDASAEGAVNMEFRGTTIKFSAVSEGAGNIDADELKASFVKCRVSGVGNASVYATDNLEAQVEGLGKISYRGNPEVDKQVDGIGLIYRK